MMDYEKFFEDDLGELSECEEEEDDHFQEREEFLCSTINKLRRELEVGKEEREGGEVEERGEEWGELMKSIQKTNQQLEEVSENIDSQVLITPRPDDVAGDSHSLKITQLAWALPSRENLAENNYEAVKSAVDEVGESMTESNEVVKAEVCDMLSEMVLSVEYIHSLSMESSSLVPSTAVHEVSSAIENNKELLEVAHFQEPDMKEPQGDIVVEDLCVYDDLVHSDNSHKRKFEIAMSVTEVAMREKEEEYNRAIEEDKIRREERRLRRQQKAIELMQAQAATTVQKHIRRYICQSRLKQERHEAAIRAEAEALAERQRAEEMARQRKQLEMELEEKNRNLLALEEKIGVYLRQEYMKEQEEIEAERQRLLAQEEAERQRLIAEEEAARKAEEAQRLEREREQERLRTEREEVEKKKQQKINDDITSKKGSKKQDTDKSRDVKPKKPSWGGFIQRTLGFGNKKDQHEGETVECDDRDEANYDEHFVYSDNDDSESYTDIKIEALQPATRNDVVTLEPPDILTSRDLSRENSLSGHLIIEEFVQQALTNCAKDVQFTQDSFPASELQRKMSSVGNLSFGASHILIAAFEHWRNSPTAQSFSQRHCDRNSRIERHCDASKRLEMSVESLTSIQFLKKHPHVESLDLNVNSIKKLDGLAEFSPQLMEISLKDNKLHCALGLQGLRNLQVLHLDSNQLEKLTSLADLRELSELSVQMNSLSSFPPLTSPALSKLELYGNRITSLEEKHLQSLCSLTHLNIGRNQLSHVNGLALSQCPLLTQLILSQNKLRELPSPLYLPNLRSLWLGHNNLSSLNSWNESSSQSSWPVFLPLLEKLFLNDNSIESFGTHTVATSPFLSEIDLSFNNIKNFSDLSGIVFCERLNVLQLQDNPVNNERGMMNILNYYLPQAKEISGNSLQPQVGGRPKFTSIRPFLFGAGDEIASFLKAADTDILCQSDDVINDMRYEEMMFEVARAALYRCGRLISLQRMPEGWGNDTERRLLMTLSRMSSEHRFIRSKERVQVETMNSNGLFEIASDSSVTELCLSHVNQLLNWSPETCEKVLLFRDQIAISKKNGQRRTSRRRGSTKEALWRQEARKGHAALRIQACIRGFLLRRNIESALRGAKYEDDELDAMMHDQDSFMREYGSILSSSDVPELSENWLQTRCLPVDSARGSKSLKSHHDENVEDHIPENNSSSNCSVVYGDHKRRRRIHTPDDDNERLEPFSPDHNIDTSRRSPRSNQYQIPRDVSQGRLNHAGDNSITSKVNEWVTGSDFLSSNDKVSQSSVRPPQELDASSFHEISINRPPLSTSSSRSNVASESYSRPASRSSNISTSSTPNRRGVAIGGLDDLDDSLPPTARSTSSRSDWDAAHSTTVATMISARGKRNKQEKSKDPTERFEAFQKMTATYGNTVQTCKGNTSKSGSFGGRPKAIRRTAKKGKKGAPPAWLRGKDED